MLACAGSSGSASTSAIATTAPASTSTTFAGTSTSTSTTTTSPTTTAAPAYSATIYEVDEARLAHSYTPDCPVVVDDLVMIGLNHWGLDGAVHRGDIVVARSRGNDVVEIFRRLFEIGYPVHSVIPIGDLPEGIEDDDPDYNNTSGLHCRYVAGTTTWSEHAKGLAIDINPFLNPFITQGEIWPANAGKYRDRTLGEPGMIVAGDEVVGAFAESGWHWGGYWESSKDYHHFSVTGR
ncbi:MAG: M15 family metallopeptidase [Acidimicrobiia bacterium]